MLATLGLALLAGGLSVLSPCVLPLLPVLVGGALQEHRLAPLALAAGLAGAFTAVGLFVAGFGFALGIDGGVIRLAAATVMAAFGLVMLSPRLQAGFARAAGAMSGGANGLLGRISGEGPGGQFVLGTVLGAVWSPCAGPTLGAAIGLAAQSGTVLRAAAIMAAFSLGACAPMLILAYGSRTAMAARRDRLARLGRAAKPVMGGFLVAMGAMILGGIDKAIETRLTAAMPPWLVDLTTKF